MIQCKEKNLNAPNPANKNYMKKSKLKEAIILNQLGWLYFNWIYICKCSRIITMIFFLTYSHVNMFYEIIYLLLIVVYSFICWHKEVFKKYIRQKILCPHLCGWHYLFFSLAYQHHYFPSPEAREQRILVEILCCWRCSLRFAENKCLTWCLNQKKKPGRYLLNFLETLVVSKEQ